MKNLKLIALLIAFSVSSLTFAIPTNNDPKSELHDQIVKLLSNPDLNFKSNELVADVVFTLNDKAELVVISVNSEDLSIESFIRSNLNYQKVDVAALNPGKIYKVPVRIVKES